MLRWKIDENGKIKMELIKDAEVEKGDEHKDGNGDEKSYGDADIKNGDKHKYEDGSLERNGDGVIENRDKH